MLECVGARRKKVCSCVERCDTSSGWSVCVRTHVLALAYGSNAFPNFTRALTKCTKWYFAPSNKSNSFSDSYYLLSESVGVLSSKQGSSREEKDCSFYSVNTLLIWLAPWESGQERWSNPALWLAVRAGLKENLYGWILVSFFHFYFVSL